MMLCLRCTRLAQNRHSLFSASVRLQPTEGKPAGMLHPEHNNRVWSLFVRPAGGLQPAHSMLPSRRPAHHIRCRQSLRKTLDTQASHDDGSHSPDSQCSAVATCFASSDPVGVGADPEGYCSASMLHRCPFGCWLSGWAACRNLPWGCTRLVGRGCSTWRIAHTDSPGWFSPQTQRVGRSGML